MNPGLLHYKWDTMQFFYFRMGSGQIVAKSLDSGSAHLMLTTASVHIDLSKWFQFHIYMVYMYVRKLNILFPHYILLEGESNGIIIAT